MRKLIKAVYEWYICLGEDPELHKTKVEFFALAKPYDLAAKGVLWSFAKAIYPSSLATMPAEVIYKKVITSPAVDLPYLI